MALRVLQVGAGSMGTRRLRDLGARRDVEAALYDAREDRRERARTRFGVPVFASLEEALSWKPQALSVSTPPDAHGEYVDLALERGLHHFSEANLWTPSWREVEEAARRKGLVATASGSLIHLPVVAALRRVVGRELGRLFLYQMCLSAWEPGWHPGEGEEYYARRRSTSAGREMVPFELSWLDWVFGTPAVVSGTVTRRGTLPGHAEDTWCMQAALENGATAHLAVTMDSPETCRRGLAVGEKGVVDFDLTAGVLVLRRGGDPAGAGERIECGKMGEVLEETYAREIGAFVDACLGRPALLHTYRESAAATAALAALEASAVSGRPQPLDLDRQPAPLPDGYPARGAAPAAATSRPFPSGPRASG